MNQQSVKSIPVSQLILFLAGASVLVQGILMLIAYLSWDSAPKDTHTFLVKLLNGSLNWMIAGLMLALPNIFFIRRLNGKLRWGERSLLRIFAQLVLTVLIACVISTILTLLSELLVGYKMPLMNVLINNGLLFSIINISLMTILEGWMFFRENRQNREKAERLANELMALRFEVLKDQINSHFMFNNLNVLSALIDGTPDKAQQFIAEFADLYRYVLDTIEKPVVTVAQELRFIRSYFFMQQIRHGDAMILTDTVPEDVYESRIPPFSLQTVIENAIKHNAADARKPLKIELFNENGYLVVKNNIQPPVSSKPSTGLGQINLTKRYELISNTLPVFEKNEKEYIVRLPLIKDE